MSGNPQDLSHLAAWSDCGLDLPGLFRAHALGTMALRLWHKPDGEDVTVFEGVSLGHLWRTDLICSVMSAFRAAALRQPLPELRLGIQYDEIKYHRLGGGGPLTMRRTDLKARAFRPLARLVGLAHRKGRPSALMLSSPSNHPLRQLWLREAAGCFRLDFPFAYPPDAQTALRSLLAGARVFDPSPSVMSSEQLKKAAGIAAAIRALAQSASWRALFNFDATSFADQFAEALLPKIAAATAGLAAKCVAFERELDRLGTELIILPQEISTDAQILIHLARRKGIAVWFMNHGFPYSGYSFDRVSTCSDLESDLILAWSIRDRENYLEAGAKPDQVVAAGNWNFDRFFPLRPPKPFQGLNGARVLTLGHVSLPTIHPPALGDSEERYFDDVITMLGELGARRVLFKLHPGLVKREFYERRLKRLKPACEVRILQDESFDEALAQSDFVIGSPSTAIFETVLSGKDYFLSCYDPVSCPPPLEFGKPYVTVGRDGLRQALTSGIPVPRQVILDFLGVKGDEPAFWSCRSGISRISAFLRSTQPLAATTK